MKSIKPGRANSAMGLVMSIFGIVFAIFWIGSALNMGAPVPFAMFGVFFVIALIINFVASLQNTFGKNRLSIYDITEDGEEPDPIFTSDAKHFCSNCGERLDKRYKFCPKCGEQIR